MTRPWWSAAVRVMRRLLMLLAGLVAAAVIGPWVYDAHLAAAGSGRVLPDVGAGCAPTNDKGVIR